MALFPFQARFAPTLILSLLVATASAAHSTATRLRMRSCCSIGC